MRPGIRYLPVQSRVRAFFGIGTSAREPTATILPSLMTTMASVRSFAERPQLVTSTTVPPARTRGTGAGGTWETWATAQMPVRSEITRQAGKRREARIEDCLLRIVAHERERFAQGLQECGV